MRTLNKKEQKIYNALREVGEIHLDDLAKKLGWTRQQVLDVICPLVREFKEYNVENLVSFMKKSNKAMSEYFNIPVVDMGLLVETSLIELNTREKFFTPIYQKYIKHYKKLRGY